MSRQPILMESLNQGLSDSLSNQNDMIRGSLQGQQALGPYTHSVLEKLFRKKEEVTEGETEQEDIDYDLKREGKPEQEDDDVTDIEEADDWHGVEREGQEHHGRQSDSDHDDDDDQDGGHMMPILDF